MNGCFHSSLLSHRCGSGTGPPGLQLAGLPLPVSRHLLLFLAAQYLSRVSFLPTISQRRISIGGPADPSLLLDTHNPPLPPPHQALHFSWLRPTLVTFHKDVWRSNIFAQDGRTCALNCSLSSILTPSSGRGGWTKDSVCLSSLLILCFPPYFLI